MSEIHYLLLLDVMHVMFPTF